MASEDGESLLQYPRLVAAAPIGAISENGNAAALGERLVISRLLFCLFARDSRSSRSTAAVTLRSHRVWHIDEEKEQ